MNLGRDVAVRRRRSPRCGPDRTAAACGAASRPDQAGREEGDEQGGDGDRPPRDGRDERGSSGDHAHGKPPFEEGPARTLPGRGGQREEVVDVVGHPRRRDRGQDVGQLLLEPVRRSKELMRSALAEAPWRSGLGSMSSSARIAASDRCSRDLPSRAGSRVPPPSPAAAARGSSGRRRPRAGRDRGAEAPAPPGRGRRRTSRCRRWRRRPWESARPRSTRRRRRRRIARQERTVMRWIQASNRSGSRNPGRSRQARDERLLDRVARELRVVEDQSGRRVQARDVPADEHGEGVMIASSGPLDENSLVHGRPPVVARPFGRARIVRCRRGPDRFPSPAAPCLRRPRARGARSYRRRAQR